LAGNVFYQFVGEHITGRYSKAHAHASAAVLVCIKGKGYTYTWPRAIGMTPWQDGKTDQVYRQDYEPVGVVTAAPYGGDWFHAQFRLRQEAVAPDRWVRPNKPRQGKGRGPGGEGPRGGGIRVAGGRHWNP